MTNLLFVDDVMDRNSVVKTFISKYLLRGPRVATSADIISILFIKTILKDSKKVKRIENYVPKTKNLLISTEKMPMSAEIMGCVTLFIYFLDLLCQFHHFWTFGHFWTDFRERGF